MGVQDFVVSRGEIEGDGGEGEGTAQSVVVSDAPLPVKALRKCDAYYPRSHGEVENGISVWVSGIRAVVFRVVGCYGLG